MTLTFIVTGGNSKLQPKPASDSTGKSDGTITIIVSLRGESCNILEVNTVMKALDREAWLIRLKFSRYFSIE